MHRASLKPLFQALIERPDSPWLREGAHHVLHDLAKMGFAEGALPVLAALEGIESTATGTGRCAAPGHPLTDSAQRIPLPR